MNTYEIMVIAAAAVVFVIANIIMWSIIASKERKEKIKALTAAEFAADHLRRTGGNADIKPQTSQPSQQPAQEKPVFDPAAFNDSITATRSKHKEKRSDFVIKDDIVLVHTSEVIDI